MNPIDFAVLLLLGFAIGWLIAAYEDRINKSA